MKTTVYLSRKLLNQLKVKETESKDLMLTHNLHNIIINGKRVGCSRCKRTCLEQMLRHPVKLRRKNHEE